MLHHPGLSQRVVLGFDCLDHAVQVASELKHGQMGRRSPWFLKLCVEGPGRVWRVRGKDFLLPPTLSCPPAWDLPDPYHWLLELALRGAG